MEYEEIKKQEEWFRRGVTLFLIISFLSGLYFLSDYANSTLKELGEVKEYFFYSPVSSGQQYLALKPSAFKSTSYQPKDINSTIDYKSSRADFNTSTTVSVQNTSREERYSTGNTVVLMPEYAHNQRIYQNRSNNNNNSNEGTDNLNSALSGTLLALKGEKKEENSNNQPITEDNQKPFASVNASQPQFVYVPPSGDPDEGNTIPAGDATPFLCVAVALYAILKYRKQQKRIKSVSCVNQQSQQNR